MREIPRHTPYSPEMVRACLVRAFTGYHEKALKEWIQQDPPISPPEFRAPRSALPILICSPSTVFAASWQAATAVWLAGRRPVIKPSRREPVFARLLQESVKSIAGKTLPLDLLKPSHSRLSPNYQAIIAYGHDQTLNSLQIPRSSFHAPRFISFGSRMSIAIAGKTLARKDLAQAICNAALDAVLYETQGCLSPQCFFVEKGGPVSAEKFAEALAMEIRRLNSKLPQISFAKEPLEEESFWQKWNFRASRGKAKFFGQHVVFHREPHFEPCGLRRVVFVVPLQRLSNLSRRLGEWKSRLSTLAASDLATLAKLKNLFHSARQMRLCLIGQMHEPPPSWRNGGINLLLEISRTEKMKATP